MRARYVVRTLVLGPALAALGGWLLAIPLGLWALPIVVPAAGALNYWNARCAMDADRRRRARA